VPAVDETVPDGLLESTLPETGEAIDSANLGSAAKVISCSESASLTINEEDHLRITVTRNDLNLGVAWDQINQLDDRIEQQLGYAYCSRWGYLTACPANVGTGMRVSVLVHLPALAMTGQIDKIIRSLQRINIVARGVFGDKAVGDFFRISNQATLGINESDLIKQVSNVIPELVKYEREARKFLVSENREGLWREVALALEEICQWDLDDDSEHSHEQILTLLSQVRMGVGTGLIGQDDANRVNRLFSLVQLRHRLLAAVEREDYRQASELRDQIAQLEAVGWNPPVFNPDSDSQGNLDNRRIDRGGPE
jgi:protein arginine kinase